MRWQSLALGLAAMLGLAIASCEPARSIDPGRPTKKEEPIPRPFVPSRPAPLPADFAWMEPDRALMQPEIPIVFIHEETHPAEWNKLKSFWTLEQPPKPQGAAALIGLSPLGLGTIAAATTPVVKIKIPSGLDPIGPAQVPAYNPPTVGKWELGKILFFDPTLLQPEESGNKISCSGCHQPRWAFSNGSPRPMELGWEVNTASLVNAVYNKHFFWDGRASSLEEVVQRVLEDEREPWRETDEPKRHVWTGVIRRLRDSPEYNRRFKAVFGTPPTQDALGKALATFMRTIFSGNSLHDRAEQVRKERKGKTLEPADYEKVLDDEALRAVILETKEKDKPPAKADVAKQLHAGYTLFHGKARCNVCHSGGNFTDSNFHNIGIDPPRGPYKIGEEPGRFAALPVGQKNERMIGAYKTPTLRSLVWTGWYFHTGNVNDLVDAIQLHIMERKNLPYLDPELADPKNPENRRDLGLKEDDLRALAMFLRALNGEALAPAVADFQTWPDGTKSPLP